MRGEIEVREADLGDEAEIETLFGILDAYARGSGGQNAPLSDAARSGLGSGLAAESNVFVLFGSMGGRVLGAAVSYWGFSTFGGRPFLHLEDFSVLPEAQGQGIGSALLAELERRARARGCCKMTLEVNAPNEGARRLYERAGFEGWEPATLHVAKAL